LRQNSYIEKEVKNDKGSESDALSFPEAIENVDFNIDDEEVIFHLL